MLLYIHVPFCGRKCHYCAFYSEPLLTETEDVDRVQTYVDTLLLEIAQWADYLGPVPIETVFFGGGTPSILPPKTLGIILNRLHKAFKFSSRAEISLEANPESLNTRTKAREYVRLGVNRISLGVQSFDPETLEIIGRVHSANTAIAAYTVVREAYCQNVNIDLMWGLPMQKLRSWLQTLKTAIRLEPDHISSYGLSLEIGTKLSRAIAGNFFELPSEKESASMFLQGAEMLEAAGLMQYEISNFSRMGYQCRHNLGYWEGLDYLGLGPAATSTLQGRRLTNPDNLEAWQTQVRNKQLTKNIEILDTTSRILELVMLRLRTVRGLKMSAYQHLTGRDFWASHRVFLEALHKEHLIRVRNGYLSLTKTGLLVSDSILRALMQEAKEHLARDKAVNA